MSLSAKTQYACLAMLQLAVDYEGGEPTPLRRIAEVHGISPAFLVQILQELKHVGLVVSTRGAAGGYRLAGSPEQTSLAEVVSVFELLDATRQCAADASPLAPLLMEVCDQLAAARRTRLESIMLADLASQSAMHAEPMWFI